MKAFYNVTGSERKSLVATISQEMNSPTDYLGAPTFAYQVSGYHIDKTGLVQGPDNSNLVTDLQVHHSFIAERLEYDKPMRSEESDVGIEAQAIIPDEKNTITIEFPLEGFTDESIVNLHKLISSKAILIRKALGINSLPIEKTETTLQFPWFSASISTDDIAAYVHFIQALCVSAKNQNRVNAKEKDIENEKFAFRVFLIRLGFVGDEYKAARKILLRNLSGNSAFKNKPQDLGGDRDVQNSVKSDH